MKPTSKLSAFLIIICIASSSVTANANQPNCLATAPAEPTTTTNAQVVIRSSSITTPSRALRIPSEEAPTQIAWPGGLGSSS